MTAIELQFIDFINTSFQASALPMPLYWGVGVTSGDRMLSVGGFSSYSADPTDAIYSYEQESGEWTELETRLARPMAEHVAFMVEEAPRFF